jgi:hypothetical protein
MPEPGAAVHSQSPSAAGPRDGSSSSSQLYSYVPSCGTTDINGQVAAALGSLGGPFFRRGVPVICCARSDSEPTARLAPPVAVGARLSWPN